MSAQQQIATWLYFTAFMVFAMALIGAITRLTESGLSMVEWRPLIGTIPPLSEAEWQRVFAIYQDTPEFQKKNFWMNIEDFKVIFFWEWFHRFFGRLIGLIYALPLLYFWIRRMIPQGFHLKLIGMLFLGGAQAVMGWYMVESGLVDEPAVSHYRLAAHLGLAFLIFALLIWLAQDVEGVKRFETVPKGLKPIAWGTLYVLMITMVWGAYVAGKDAGLVYNEFPLMGGYLLPPDAHFLSPAWLNITENPVMVQFLHRWMGVFAALVVLGLHGFAMAKGVRSWEIFALPALVLLQVGLGIAALLSQLWIPVATAHQAGALLLLGTMTSLIRKIS